MYIIYVYVSCHCVYVWYVCYIVCVVVCVSVKCLVPPLNVEGGALYKLSLLLMWTLTGDMVLECHCQNSDSKTLGSLDLLVGQGEGKSLQVNSCNCADLLVPYPSLCVWHAPKFVHMVKILYPSVIKE